ncbi:MAG: FHA domain-containing protein [Bdellovibrionaceae bacterium]|nr:FHA domain-containing protein [Pseudobdellovibrionaceae bacterium]
MAQLLITYKSQDYAELELDEQQEYIIGRSQEADIPLEGGQSLSRKHSSLYYQGGSWVIKKLSRSGELLYKNELIEEQVLENQSAFTIGDFVFLFQTTTLEKDFDTNQEQKAEESEDEYKSEEGEESHEPEDAQTPSEDKESPLELDNEEVTSEYTAIIKSNLSAQLNIYKPGKKLSESVKLTENSWIIGRATDCNTNINYGKLSRYHLEINKDSSGYWVTDLGSVNGTKLNGDKLKKNESQELAHGDTIEVKKLKISFEIINENYQNFQIASTKTEAELPLENNLTGLSAVVYAIKEKQYLYIGVFAILVMAFLFSLEDKPTIAKHTNKTNQLKPGQIQLLEDNLRLAQTHYTSGKYQLCSAILKKIHASMPSYKNSKELEHYCQQAYQLSQDQKEKRRQVEEKERINNKILSIIEKCEQNFTSKKSSDTETNRCLYPAIEINPNHPGIANLTALIETRKIQTANIVATNKKNKQSYQRGLRKYRSALKLYKKNQLRVSIKAFKSFLNNSYYGVSHLKAKAKKNLQAAKKRFNMIINSSFFKCKTAFDDKQYKKAFSFCKKVLQQDPENIKTSALIETVIQKSRQQLKDIYKDSVFEESVGSVELAKKMWRKMIKKGIPNKEYYEKAKRKLQKYEGL